MAKRFPFGECSLPQDYQLRMKDNYCMILPGNLIPNLFRVAFRSAATLVKYHANKSLHRIGLSIKNEKGEFVIGVILTYNPPADENSDDEGNWNLSMTWYQEDMVDLDLDLDNFDSQQFITTVNIEMYSDGNMHCDFKESIFHMMAGVFEEIKLFLDRNSNDSDEEVTVVMDGIFEGSVSIENGKKVFGITPGAVIKQIIKNDDEAEKTNAA